MGNSCKAKAKAKEPHKQSGSSGNQNKKQEVFKVLPNAEKMLILTTYYNPSHYKVRSKLYNNFKNKILALKDSQNLELLTIECALGLDNFEVTSPNKEPFEIQVRANHPLSIKENLLNIAWQKLLANKPLLQKYKYVAWIDHDIEFFYDLWPKKVRNALGKHAIVQLFNQCQIIGMHNEILTQRTSFAAAYLQNPFNFQGANIDTGFAWATTTQRLFNLGSFYQDNILGLGDRHMAYGIIGNVNAGFPVKMSPGYEKSVFEWVKRAEVAFQKNLGFVELKIKHHWHGKYENRNEQDRMNLLQKWGYDPLIDLNELPNKVLQLKEEKEGLIKEIADWFKNRNEDEEFIPKKKGGPSKAGGGGKGKGIQKPHGGQKHHKKKKEKKDKDSGDDGDDGDDFGDDFGDDGNDGDEGNDIIDDNNDFQGDDINNMY